MPKIKFNKLKLKAKEVLKNNVKTILFSAFLRITKNLINFRLSSKSSNDQIQKTFQTEMTWESVNYSVDSIVIPSNSIKKNNRISPIFKKHFSTAFLCKSNYFKAKKLEYQL